MLSEIEYAYHITDEEEISKLSDKYSRIYVGHDACPKLLPSYNQMRSYITLCKKKGISLTLLTSFLFDNDIMRLRRLLDLLYPVSKQLDMEIVMNDWGLLELIDATKLKILLGRLLSKQKKGLLLSSEKNNSTTYSEAHRQLHADYLQPFLSENGINRVETDNVKQGIVRKSDLLVSVYYPYVLASVSTECVECDLNLGNCSKSCEDKLLLLSNPCLHDKILYKGNSQFYLNKRSLDFVPDRLVLWEKP